MTPDAILWSRVQTICDAALSRQADDRDAYLTVACDSPALRQEVESLLAQEKRSERFLTPTALEMLAHALLPASAGSLTGQHVGPYEIKALIGAGGMGEVYRAFDQRLHRDVAVKVLPTVFNGNPDRLRRFEQEARAAAALNHSNILALYDIGRHDDAPYIVSELLEGETLAERLKREPLGPIAAVDIAIQLAQALAAAHEASIVHRDLKPANIFITHRLQVKVLDFGLAKMLGSPTPAPGEAGVSSDGSQTAAGIGTTAYMSPEQTKGAAVDPRSDIWSLGVVLYEMVTGQRPFRGDGPASVAAAIASATPDPPSRVRAGLEADLDRIVDRALAKLPEQRYQAVGDLLADLQMVRRELAQPSMRLSRRSRRLVLASTVMAAALAAAAVGWWWHRSGQEQWARDLAIPEISRLLDAGEFARAAALTEQARTIFPKDPTLANFWTRATIELFVHSEPSGADVSIRPYRDDQDVWEFLGKTPLDRLHVPKTEYVWRLTKAGFAPAIVLTGYVPAPQPGLHMAAGRTVRLRPESEVPPEMLVVQGGATGLGFPHQLAPTANVGDFLIDQHEVTNEQFKKFVDAGGYTTREFWAERFVKDGRDIPWEQAVALFRDATARPGPATWVGGNYPNGMEKHPVAGVSWYEAAAYVRFAGKSLPTAYHWTLASQSAGLHALIAGGSNFRGTGTHPVGGPGALSGFGTTDMAGNVKEWCSNEGADGKRFILGGGFGDPQYMFNFTDQQNPWDRRSNFGFRGIKLLTPSTVQAAARIEITSRDYNKEKPVSEDVFKAYVDLYRYDTTELHPRIEESETASQWTREKVSFDAAYGSERVIAQLFLPSHTAPPFQVVVYFPGGFAFVDQKLDIAQFEDSMDFFLRSGRALIIPIYKGTYERREDLKPGDQPPAFGQPPALFRDDMIMWSKDLGRTLDYLETRADIDRAKFAYMGFSHGGQIAPTLLAVEKRFKAAILSSGGLMLRRDLPEVDRLNFVTHVKVPVLMLNGRYDASFPLESSQLPLLRLLGTLVKDKRHVVYGAGHGNLPRGDEVRESLEWLDRYLGPVRH
jgi:eukaryotic-like serine/threonine-protein kinase